MNRTTATLALAVGGALAAAAPARAQIPECVSGRDLNATHDLHFFRHWQCRQDKVDKYWYDIGLNRGGWSGAGYEDPCNLTLPLGRTLNAIAFLEQSQEDFRNRGSERVKTWGPDQVYLHTTLPWKGYDFAKKIDALGVVCRDDGNDAYTTPWLPHSVTVYRGFTEADVIGRAGLLIHEARHHDNKAHVSDCAAGDCDHHFGPTTWLIPDPWFYADDGAYTYQVKYLWEWASGCDKNCTWDMRYRAWDEAQGLLDTRFTNRPNIRTPRRTDPVYTPPEGETCPYNPETNVADCDYVPPGESP